MATYKVQFTATALQQLAELPPDVQVRIRPRIDALAGDPRPSGCKKLVGEPGGYRIRVGDYRVVYALRDDIFLVLVVRIAHRREVYR